MNKELVISKILKDEINQSPVRFFPEKSLKDKIENIDIYVNRIQSKINEINNSDRIKSITRAINDCVDVGAEWKSLNDDILANQKFDKVYENFKKMIDNKNVGFIIDNIEENLGLIKVLQNTYEEEQRKKCFQVGY